MTLDVEDGASAAGIFFFFMWAQHDNNAAGNAISARQVMIGREGLWLAGTQVRHLYLADGDFALHETSLSPC